MRGFCRQLGWELRKLFYKRRTWIGFAAFIVSELVLLWLLQYEPVRQAIRRDLFRLRIPFEDNFSGLTVAAYMMGHTMSALGNLYLALAAGEMIAQETEEKTLRTIFCRPVSRASVFLQKLLVSFIYTSCVVWFIGISALAIGLFFEGPGNLVLWSFVEKLSAWYDFEEGLKRYLLSLVFLNLSVFSVASLAFAFSCFRMKPAAATALALTVFIADDSLRNIPRFASVREYFLMSHIVEWLRVYDLEIPWKEMAQNYAGLFIANAVVILIAWWHFRGREFKN